MKRLAALVLISCSSERALPPRGQVVLHLDTDAPVPRLVDDPSAPLPLFDHLRLDVSDCEDLARCPLSSRDFEIDEERLREGTLSIGIVPAKPGDRPVVRARLFLGAASETTEPPIDVTIDVRTVLPEISAEGILERTLFLPTDAVGKGPITADTSDGAPSPSLVATWPGARRVECATTPPAGEICIPGGAFWMGSARLKDYRLFLDPAADARRLVVLSPFMIDATEVTVGALRGHGTAIPFSGSRAGAEQTDWCTFTSAKGANESQPVNCIDRKTAHDFCVSQGKDFPTEAQFEYVASNLGRSLWPWGSDVAVCADAVVARAYGGIDPTSFTDSAACFATKPVEGPLTVGTYGRDRVEIGGGTVFDLVGNLSEFARDIFQYRDDDCWSRRGVYVDPVCDHYGTTEHGFAMKGGNFWWAPGLSFAALRFPINGNGADPLWGFRCVRADTFE